jgi:hypothetical protein
MSKNNNYSNKEYVSLSFSCPPEMEDPLNGRAADLRLTRSEYLRRLVIRDLSAANLLDPEELALDAPPRIKRGRPTRKKVVG